MPSVVITREPQGDDTRNDIGAPQCFVTTLHFVTTASLICPASWAQATSSTLTEISLPTKPLSCAACASLEVMSWKVSGPVSRLQRPLGGGSRRGALVSW